MEKIIKKAEDLISNISNKINLLMENNYKKEIIDEINDLTKIMELVESDYNNIKCLNTINNNFMHLYCLSNKEKRQLANSITDYTAILYNKLCKNNPFEASLLDDNKNNMEDLKESLNNVIDESIDNDEPLDHYKMYLNLEKNIEIFESLNFGFNTEDILEILFNEDSVDLATISSKINSNVEYLQNHLSKLEKKVIEKKQINVHSPIIKGIATTLIIATIIISSTTCDLSEKDTDKNIEYLKNNGYESLIPCYLNGELKNIECADLYIKYSKKYEDIDMDIIISTIDDIVFSYINTSKDNVSIDELEESIDNELKLSLKSKNI